MDTFSPAPELWLMPAGIAGSDMSTFATNQHINVLQRTQVWVVEDARTARRMISSVVQGYNFNERQWFELAKESHHETRADWKQAMKQAAAGAVWSLMSEAGMPGIADPGAEVVSWAHQLGWIVRVLSGPSSIIMALAASGFNGQQFAFHGYLPVDGKALGHKIQELEQAALRGATQLFIETPYRTERMFQALLQHLRPGTSLAVMAGLDSAQPFCGVRTAAAWAKQAPHIGKLPAVFLIGIPKT
jgi:16S rRNA (cytidine1402-2'-O)-methyltransferase